jgi:hypothetical protein
MQSIQTQSQETTARLPRRNLQRYESALICPSPRFRSDRITPAKTQTRNHKLPEQIVLQSTDTEHNRRTTLRSRRNACETVFHLLRATHYSTYIGNRPFWSCDVLDLRPQGVCMLFSKIQKTTRCTFELTKSNGFEMDETVRLLITASCSRRT